MTFKKVKDIVVDKIRETFADAYYEPISGKEGNLVALANAVNISPAMEQCIKSGPKDIHGLNDGLAVRAYEFDRTQAARLRWLGFVGVNFNNIDKLTVIEYCQTGSQICNQQLLKYGIGARLMMKIKKTDSKAKIDTPHQVGASVIFNMASVQFELMTFGIVGPGTSALVSAGTLSEDTYTKFIHSISSLLIEAYKTPSQFIITPQPLFLFDDDEN